MKIDPRCDLLSRILTDLVAELQHGRDPDRAWAEASRALATAHEEDDVELFVAVEDKDADALRRIVRGWASGERTLPPTADAKGDAGSAAQPPSR